MLDLLLPNWIQEYMSIIGIYLLVILFVAFLVGILFFACAVCIFTCCYRIERYGDVTGGAYIFYEENKKIYNEFKKTLEQNN